MKIDLAVSGNLSTAIDVVEPLNAVQIALVDGINTQEAGTPGWAGADHRS